MYRFDVFEPGEIMYHERPLEVRQENTFQSIEDLVYYLILHEGIDFAKIAQLYVRYLEAKDVAHSIENAESTMVALYASDNAPNISIPQDVRKDHAERWLYNYGNIPTSLKLEVAERLEKRNVNVSGTMGFGDLYKE